MSNDRGSLQPAVDAYAGCGCAARPSAGTRIATSLWLAAAAVVNGVADAVTDIRVGMDMRRRRRGALSELHSLDDRMLKDIGLDRGRIPEVAERMARNAVRSRWPERTG